MFFAQWYFWDKLQVMLSKKGEKKNMFFFFIIWLRERE